MNLLRSFPFVLALLMIGCATAPMPADVGTLSSDDVRNRLLRNGNSLNNFAADGSITITTPTMSQSVGFELASRGADSVKMSLFGPFGITVGAALFTKKEFTAYNALNNTVYRGSPERQMRVLPFIKEIPFELFMGTLQGIHHLNSIGAIDSLTMTPDGGYSFSISHESGSYDRYLYNSAMNRIVRCTRYNDTGTSLWSVRYQYSRSDSGEVIPREVEVSITAKESSLLIEYAGIVNGAPEEEFILPYPDDAEIVTIE